MSLWSLILIALGVSADAFAVALGKGMHMTGFHLGRALALAGTFGGFQALMPLLGWVLGTGLSRYIQAVDHWIVFGLLLLIGARMIQEAFAPEEESEDDERFSWTVLLMLGVATSIDALAVGVGLAFLGVSIAMAVALIGLTTFATSLLAVRIGHHVGSRLGTVAEALGGLILIGIGTSTLLEHVVFV